VVQAVPGEPRNPGVEGGLREAPGPLDLCRQVVPLCYHGSNPLHSSPPGSMSVAHSLISYSPTVLSEVISPKNDIVAGDGVNTKLIWKAADCLAGMLSTKVKPATCALPAWSNKTAVTFTSVTSLSKLLTITPERDF